MKDKKVEEIILEETPEQKEELQRQFMESLKGYNAQRRAAQQGLSAKLPPGLRGRGMPRGLRG